MIIRRLIGAGVLSMTFCGCFTVQKGEHEFKTVDHGAFEQYTVNKIDKVEFVAVPGSKGNSFCLEAVGSFTVHSGRRQARVDKGVRMMSIGIWPGYNCLQGEKTGYVVCQSLLYWWNPFAWGASLWSTFITPFSDEYSDVSSGGGGLLILSMFGCVKYIDTKSVAPVQEYMREGAVRKEDRVRLYNYRLVYNGGEYYDDNGIVKLFGTFRRGQTVPVRLVSAPALRPDTDERIDDLVGVNIESAPLP